MPNEHDKPLPGEVRAAEALEYDGFFGHTIDVNGRNDAAAIIARECQLHEHAELVATATTLRKFIDPPPGRRGHEEFWAALDPFDAALRAIKEEKP